MTLNSPVMKLAAFSALAFLFTSCKNGDTTPAVTPDPPIQLVTTLTGPAEKPTSVSSAATGTFVGQLDRASRVLSYTLTYSGLTPTAGHLHRVTAANGTGGVDVPFASLASPIIGTTTISTVGKVDSLINGFYYANLHTTAYPNGEIRGNVRVSGPVKLNATLNGASEKPTSNTSAAAGTFAGIIDPATRVLSYTVTYSGLAPTAGHLHRITAANGTGGVEIPFASLVSPIIGTTTLTTNGRVDSLFNGFYYANLHTTVFPGGEIRGDVK